MYEEGILSSSSFFCRGGFLGFLVALTVPRYEAGLCELPLTLPRTVPRTGRGKRFSALTYFKTFWFSLVSPHAQVTLPQEKTFEVHYACSTESIRGSILLCYISHSSIVDECLLKRTPPWVLRFKRGVWWRKPEPGRRADDLRLQVCMK